MTTATARTFAFKMLNGTFKSKCHDDGNDHNDNDIDHFISSFPFFDFIDQCDHHHGYDINHDEYTDHHPKRGDRKTRISHKSRFIGNDTGMVFAIALYQRRGRCAGICTRAPHATDPAASFFAFEQIREHNHKPNNQQHDDQTIHTVSSFQIILLQ